ncbi:unnamed protein product [Caenorhabditis nigoni]
MTPEFSKIEVKESETKIKNVSKDFEEKVAKLQEGLKNQKDLLEEQRVLEAQSNQTIKDLSTALESWRNKRRWIPMLEKQLEYADRPISSWNAIPSSASSSGPRPQARSR